MLTNLINGRFVDSHGSQTTTLIDPVTEHEYEQSVVSTPQDVDDALQAADTAFTDWSRTTPAKRQLALLKIADELERRASDFIAAEVQDTGKPRAATTEEEFPMAVDHLRFFAGAVRVPEGVATDSYLPELTSSIRREPIGVIAQVSPWNFPLLMAIWKIAPAIGTGNTVVLKPAEDTPTTTLMLAELAQKFLPPGVFNVVLGGRETGAALTQHPIPAMVAITGSVRAGREVALSAADSHKQTHLELGGNAPVVVFADADLDAAAEMIVAGAYSNGGQDCTAAARVLIHDSVHDDLLTKIVAQAANVKTGHPDDDVAYGPLINADHFARVQSLIDNLPAHARIETGGHRQGEEGYFIAPTVISGVRQDDQIVQQEIFGPVMTVQRFSDESEAILMANDTEYGLASSVWTTDHARALRMSRALNFGCVWLNTHLYLAGEMPHGGFGASGHGKDMSRYSLEAYTRIKHVMSFTPDSAEGA